MANLTSFYNDRFRASSPNRDGRLPQVSTALDSVRSYNFEIQFNRIPIVGDALRQLDPQAAAALLERGAPSSDVGQFFTLAANKVTSAGHKVADIAVRRLNDNLYYPGGADSDVLTITFDHLLLREPMHDLYTWFQTAAYNASTGRVSNSVVAKAGSVDVVYLDNARNIKSITTYFGVYPQSFKPAESSYGQNNTFHTFEVAFRYDFMNYKGRGDLSV